MPRFPRLPVLAALALGACATPESAGKPVSMRPPGPADAPVPPFERDGEIQLTLVGSAGSSAAWNARSVRGPAVNMTLTDQELWGGTIRDRAVLLRAQDGRITGEGVDLRVRQEGTAIRVYGMWFGALLRVEVTPQGISASPLTGFCGLEMGLTEDGYYRGFGGCGGRLDMLWMRLKGVAADPASEMPQWLFAFLAALPSLQVSTFPASAMAPPSGPIGGGVLTFLPAEFRGMPPAGWTQVRVGSPTMAGVLRDGPFGRYASVGPAIRTPGRAGGMSSGAAGLRAGSGGRRSGGAVEARGERVAGTR